MTFQNRFSKTDQDGSGEFLYLCEDTRKVVGASLVDIQVAGRWKDPGMPAHYVCTQFAERGAIARFKDGK